MCTDRAKWHDYNKMLIINTLSIVVFYTRQASKADLFRFGPNAEQVSIFETRECHSLSRRRRWTQLFRAKTGENDKDEPTEAAVQSCPSEGAEDSIGNEGLVKAGTGSGIGRGHLIEW